MSHSSMVPTVLQPQRCATLNGCDYSSDPEPDTIGLGSETSCTKEIACIHTVSEVRRIKGAEDVNMSCPHAIYTHTCVCYQHMF